MAGGADMENSLQSCSSGAKEENDENETDDVDVDDATSEAEFDGDDMNLVKSDLRDAIDDIAEARAWCSYGIVPSVPPIPGLYLKDGIVGLPLSSHDASRVKLQATDAAPTGGAIVDKDDLTCDLASSKFGLRNPAWHSFAQDVARQAVKPYDIGTVSVTLRSLRLSNDKGGVEDPKADSTLPRDVIGTLLIILQSQHEGGSFLLSHEGEIKRFAPSITSEFGQSYVAWYSDVKVDVEPIISGQRLQLVYDLYQPQNAFVERPSAAAASAKASQVQSALQRWLLLRQEREAASPLIYMLKDNSKLYKRRDLRLDALEDADKFKALHLQQQCLQLKICLYMARMTSSIDGDQDPEDDYAYSIKLPNVTDLTGSQIVSKPVSLSRDNLVDNSGLELRESNDSDYDTPEPDTPEPKRRDVELESPSDWRYRTYDTPESDDFCDEVESRSDKNFRYLKDWALVMLPDDERLSFITDHMNAQELDAWILQLTTSLRSSEGHHVGVSQSGTADSLNIATVRGVDISDTRAVLSYLCEKALPTIRPALQMQDRYFSDIFGNQRPCTASKPLEHLVQATLILGECRLFSKAIAERPEILLPEMLREVGRVLDKSNFAGYTEALGPALAQIKTIHGRHQRLESILAGYRESHADEANTEVITTWIRSRLEEALNGLEVAEDKDSEAAVAIGTQHGQDLMSNVVVPFVKRNGSNLSFAFKFVAHLCRIDPGKLDKEGIRWALKEVFATLIPALTSNDSEVSAKRQKLAPSSTATRGFYSTQRWTLSGTDIARMVEICVANNLKDEGNRLLDKMMLDTINADAGALEVIFMDFLQALRRIMLEHNIPCSSEKYQGTFQYIIRSFVAECVGMEPKRPENYAGDALKKIGCGLSTCYDCDHLDRFCQRPKERTWQLQGTIKRRDHVKSRVQGSRRFRTEIIQKGRRSHTLRIHKTQYELWKSDHNDWSQRCASAKRKMENIGYDALRELLADKYEECVHLQSVKIRPSTVIPERPSPKSKGRTQVIDLSEY